MNMLSIRSHKAIFSMLLVLCLSIGLTHSHAVAEPSSAMQVAAITDAASLQKSLQPLLDWVDSVLAQAKGVSGQVSQWTNGFGSPDKSLLETLGQPFSDGYSWIKSLIQKLGKDFFAG